MAGDKDSTDSQASDLERWRDQGREVAAEAAKDKQRSEVERFEQERSVAAREWQQAAVARDSVSETVLAELSRRLSGEQLYEAGRRRRRPTLLVALVVAPLLGLVVLLLPDQWRIPFGLAGVLCYWALFATLLARVRRRAEQQHLDLARQALEPWQTWAQAQPFNVQHLADIAYIGKGRSWYRLILYFDPSSPAPSAEDVAAMITGLLDPIEPVKVQASLSSDVPEMRVDIYHREREQLEPERMQQQIKLLVEKGLVALHEESPLLAVRFGTLKASIHRD